MLIEIHMRVWVIKGGETVPLKGTERLMRAGLMTKMLHELGHEVTWWTSSVNHSSKTFFPESIENDEFILPWGSKLIFLKSILYKRNISLKRLINHWGTAKHFEKIAQKKQKPDIIICCFPTLELSHAAIKYGKKENIPVLLDVRDLYPDVYINIFPSYIKFLARMIIAPMVWKTHVVMRKATGIIAISETYLNWALTYAKRKPKKFDGVYHMSYPKMVNVQLPSDEFISNFKELEGKKIVLFVGSFMLSYDVETIIQVARHLQNLNQNEYHFVLVGDGVFGKKWREMAKDLSNITFTGWVQSHEIHWISMRSWVAVAAYKKQALQCLPNKYYEYMSFGLPILHSLKGETRDFVEQNQCGLYYEAENMESLLFCLEELRRDPQKRESMGCSSRESYEEKYSPEQVYGNLIRHAEKVVEEAKKTSLSSTKN